jgi:hypothetical protein
MILAKVTKREAVEMPAVGWVTERTEVCIVRRNDNHAALRREQAVELLHGADHVSDVFYDVDRTDFAEGAVRKGKRIMIEVRDNIRTRIRITIDANRTRIFVDPAANVEDRKKHKLF